MSDYSKTAFTLVKQFINKMVNNLLHDSNVRLFKNSIYIGKAIH